MAFQYIWFYCIFLWCYVCGNSEDVTRHPGHLKPFASHGKILNVESLNYFPDPIVFFPNYVHGSKPLHIRGGAKISPAYSLWSDEYFLTFEEGKKVTVIVEQAKKENRTLPAEEIPFTEFVKRYRSEDIYLVNDLPDFLSKDVFLPPSLLCEDLTVDYLLAKLMWFSSGGTKSVLHYDSAENINCLFAGTKELYLIDPNKYEDQVTIENPKAAYSDVDVEKVDFVKYPGLAEVEYYHVQMQPGDCLYIPFGWFHHVSSVERNLAVNVWWSSSANPHLPDCKLPNTTMEKFTFVGFDTSAMFPREIIHGIKGVLKEAFKVYENKIELENFRHYFVVKSEYFEEGATWTDDMMEKVDKVFDYFDEPSRDAVLTPEDVTSLSEEEKHNLFSRMIFVPKTMFAAFSILEKLDKETMFPGLSQCFLENFTTKFSNDNNGWDKVVMLVKELTIMVDDQFEAVEEDDYEGMNGDKDLNKDEL